MGFYLHEAVPHHALVRYAIPCVLHYIKIMHEQGGEHFVINERLSTFGDKIARALILYASARETLYTHTNTHRSP